VADFFYFIDGMAAMYFILLLAAVARGR